MRTENEMLDLIVNTAKNDRRIRAVILNGSRSNDFAIKDKYQDYDIVYIVTELQYFIDNKNWIDIFGDRIILEMPWYKDFEPSEYNGQFNYQMLFTDGNRIDLTFVEVDKAKEIVEDDKVGRVLLDKDKLLKNFDFDNGKIYFIKEPSKKDFENKCNTFWWCTQNVAKGIKRKELPYAMKMLDYEREVLEGIISWYIGMCNNYAVSSGKMGKYIEKYLDDNLWGKYLSTFSIGTYEALWASLFSACELFRELAVKIANKYLYDYPYNDDRSMTEYLNRLRKTE